MDGREFSSLRKALNKTQGQMAQLLGTSLKAIHSYEQGWRAVPAHVERQLLFLCASAPVKGKGRKPCWVIKKCPRELRSRCPAWEFDTGKLCWFVNGTICEGAPHKDWHAKMKICRSCEVFAGLLPEG